MQRTIAVVVMCVVMMLISASVRADDAQRRCTRIGNNWVKFWNNQKAERASEVFTKDILYEDVPLGAVFHGADEFVAFAKNVFTTFPQSTFTLVKSSCSHQQGFIEWIRNAIDTQEEGKGFFQTGLPIEVRGVSVIEIHENRISRNSDYWDFATVMGQLGCDTFPSCHKIP